MEDCICEYDEVNIEEASREAEEILKSFSDESSSVEANEKQDDASRRRKRRKKRMLTGVSRQRRAANARERRRIQGVNRAFVQLKNSLPLAQIDISKIEILRLASKWIDHLRTLLKDYEERKELLNTVQMETSRPNEFISLEENRTPVKHDCLYHQFPDLKNTLWEECIGVHESAPGGENEGCIHIRSNSSFLSLFSPH
ncbi:transcription factor 21-like [Dendronephthya gigantea]|uniref:transcription factor 21-like n=1 Tax=Dendronephthya gigantea TaxID=151771 RepID=UPI00106AB30C|nr:transcription factor 21-like [Dendronephthya gigantea]